MTTDRPTRVGVPAVLASLALAAAVAEAGLYGGATDSLGRAALAAVCALLALVWLAVPRVAGGRHARRVALAIGALAALALLQSVPLPDALARALAPLSVASRDAYGGLDGDVSPSLDADATRRAALVLLGFAVLVASMGARVPARAAPVLARALAAAALLHAGIGLAVGPYGQREAVIFGGFEVSNPFQAFGSFPNRAQFAGFETVLSGAAIWLLAGRGRPWFDRASGALVLGASAASIAASGSRAGAAGIVLAIAAAFVASPERGRRARRGAAVLLLGVAVLAGRAAGVDALTRVMPLRGDESARLELWRGSVDLALRQPLVGVGFDAFRYAYAGEGRAPGDRLVAVAENDALHLAAEGGIAGLGLAALGAAALGAGLRARARTADANARRSARLAAAGPIGLIPLALTSVPLHAPAVALASIAAGALVVALLREEAAPPEAGYPSRSHSSSEVPWRAS